MRISKARAADLDAVMRLFADARAWHRQLGVNVWSEFDRAEIAADIRAGHVFVARRGEAVLGTVTLAESDPLVWGPGDCGALYVHKLAAARSPAARGVGALILQRAQDLGRKLGKKRLRLDTWDDNPGMRRYYERQGFRHVTDKFFPLDSPLPGDYRGTLKSLYELELE